MVIHQGDVFWVDLPAPTGSEPGFRRPVVVVQNNAINHTRIATVIICALTTNLRRAQAPGNVALTKGEAGLPRPSVVNVSQIFTLDRSRLGAKSGNLGPERIRQVVHGVELLLEPMEPG